MFLAIAIVIFHLVGLNEHVVYTYLNYMDLQMGLNEGVVFIFHLVGLNEHVDYTYLNYIDLQMGLNEDVVYV